MTAGPSMHPRDIKARIWRHVLCATPQEVLDGLNFYPEANWLCCMLSAAFSVPVTQVAGIYAALSPMNTWDSNEANVIAILRWHVSGRRGFLPPVNTMQSNQVKAARIAGGEDPLDVLGGSKVRAFYRSIADPADTTQIAVNRHLFNVACGVSASKSGLSRMASDAKLYARVEKVYSELGTREGIGNRLAAIAWFVQRRTTPGQLLPLRPSGVVCCDRPMSRVQAARRWQCETCKSTRSFSSLQPRATIDGFKVRMHKSRDRHGKESVRRVIVLGADHPYANLDGWQYVARYLIMKSLGRKIQPDEHAHHVDNDKLNDPVDGSNYQLLLAETHGRHHRYIADLAGYRDALGRFTEHVEPIPL